MNLACSYVHNYKPSRSVLRKHGLFVKRKEWQKYCNLTATQRKFVIVLDRIEYNNAIEDIIRDKTKFKESPQDVAIKREAKLQRFLRTWDKMRKSV